MGYSLNADLLFEKYWNLKKIDSISLEFRREDSAVFIIKQ
jgi:hypothetical protein